MPTLPSSPSITTIADGAQIIAADHRNNYANLAAALNSLLTILAGGAAGQVFGSGGGTTVAWGAGVACQHIARTTNPGSSYDTNTVLGGVLPTTFDSLLLVYAAKSDQSGSPHSMLMRFNADAVGPYDSIGSVAIGGAGVTADEVLNSTSMKVAYLEGTLNGTALNARGQILIPQYRDTNYEKGFDASGIAKFGTASGQLVKTEYGGFWRGSGATAITRVQLFPEAGAFGSGTIIDLFGLGIL